MALTLSPVFDISVTLVDRDRNTSTMTLHAPGDLAIADVEADLVATIIPAIVAVSDALVKQWTITRSAVDDLAASDAPEASDVERKGVFSFRAADGSTYTVGVPSFKNTMVIDRTNLINTADASVAAFIAAIITGGADTAPSTYLGADITILDHARKRHRGSARG